MKWRSLAACTAVFAALGLGGCGFSGTDDWRAEERCQPAGGGWEPEQVLPDPVACPEAYEGSSDGSWAPGLPDVPVVGPSEPWEPSPVPPCSTVPSLNGFPCFDVDPQGNPGPYYG